MHHDIIASLKKLDFLVYKYTKNNHSVIAPFVDYFPFEKWWFLI